MKIISHTELKEDFFDIYELEKIANIKDILKDIKENGDTAVKKYTKKFDKIDLDKLEITNAQIMKSYNKIEKETVETIKKAVKNIEFFAKKQKLMYRDFEINSKGIILGQKIIPIDTVGCYVPGGRYPLLSSALMSIIPAKVAGVKDIFVCSPKIKPEIIVAADITGANRIFNVGGVQAIGAMAYGTESIPKVDKIVGPGNEYVTAAKKFVYGMVGIDFIAGPSELLIIADETANKKFIASDLLAQMEHDPKAKTYLLTTSKKLANDVNKEINNQLCHLKTKKVVELSIRNGLIIIVNNLSKAIEICNKKAPEHIELFVKNPELFKDKLKNYGSLFIGEYSAEVFGDYCSGTNHILPTNGAAKYTGGLSVGDFLKIVTYQKIERSGVKEIVKIASKIGEIEGLDAHKKSADIRFSK